MESKREVKGKRVLRRAEKLVERRNPPGHPRKKKQNSGNFSDMLFMFRTNYYIDQCILKGIIFG